MVSPTKCYYKTTLETELERFPKLRLEDIETLQQWITSQPHLPPVLDVQICHFLHACYYDVEVVKTTIDNYYCYKSTMKEFFTDWDPHSKATLDYAKTVIQAGFLPKKHEDDAQILLLKMKDTNVDLYNFNLGVKWLLMSVTAYVILNGQQNEFKLVYDSTGYTLSHVMKNPFSSVKNYLDFGQKASGIRVTEVHFVNSSSVVKKMLSVIKPFMNKQVLKMMNFHTTSDGFFKSLPEETIPKDYGGTAPTLEELDEENLKRVGGMRDALIAHSEQKADESKRANNKKKETKSEPQFRKLELD